MNVWEGKATIYIQKGTNIVILNLLWIICSIPILTLGSSTAAMTGVIRNWYLNEEVSVFRCFFMELRKNLKQGFLIGNMWLVAGILLIFDAYFFLQVSSSFLKVFLVAITSIATILYIMTSAFLFPVLVHYKTKGISLIKQAFTFSFLDGKTTLAVVLMWIAAGTVIFYTPLAVFVIIVPVTMVTFKFLISSFDKIEILLKSRTNYFTLDTKA